MSRNYFSVESESPVSSAWMYEYVTTPKLWRVGWDRSARVNA